MPATGTLKTEELNFSFNSGVKTHFAGFMLLAFLDMKYRKERG